MLLQNKCLSAIVILSKYIRENSFVQVPPVVLAAGFGDTKT